jgi:hypothetical protein
MRVRITSLILLLAIGGCGYVCYKPVWQFDHLERNARKVVNPAQLQAWTVSLLASHPPNGRVLLSEVGTNFPSQLLRLAPAIGPDIRVHCDLENTNQQPYVQISWGSGFLGAHSFFVGRTNFTPYLTNRWSPGVYFNH